MPRGSQPTKARLATYSVKDTTHGARWRSRMAVASEPDRLRATGSVA